MPSRAAPVQTRARGAVALLWRLRWLALAVFAFVASWSTAFAPCPARLVPAAIAALELEALDDAETPRPGRAHGLQSTGEPTDVELDVAELDEEEPDDERPAPCVAGGGSPASGHLAPSREAAPWSEESATKASRSVFGSASPRGPPV